MFTLRLHRTSSKDYRLKGYLAAADLSACNSTFARANSIHESHLSELTSDDIDAIESAGAAGARRLTAKTILRRAAGLALFTAGALAACSYFGIHII